MTWWGTELSTSGSVGIQPKQKNRFVLKVGHQVFYSVKSVTKPVAEIETKQYRLINHYYNYPGLVKWSPVEVTLVDAYRLDGENNKTLGTAEEMWRMLMFSGYATPDMTTTSNYRAPSLSTPEKASMIARSAVGSISVSHLDTNGKEIEYWELVNPMITKFNWGSLDYSSDELVEYSFTITYDWAKWHVGNPTGVDTAAPPVKSREEGDSLFGNTPPKDKLGTK